MSDLHFDADGEPAKVPADAEELRVRRFRKPGERGACEVVHGPDGAPLFVPVDATYVEFRKLVDNVPGRYRLDPVDATRRACSGAVPLYVTIDPPRNTNAAGDDRDAISRELVRAHVEMMRSNNETMNNIAAHFASMMTATAEILRAADGAGMPRRQPAPPIAPDDEEDEDGDQAEAEEDEDEDELEAEPQHPLTPLANVLAELLRQNAKAITAYTTSKMMSQGAPAAPAAAVPETPSPATSTTSSVTSVAPSAGNEAPASVAPAIVPAVAAPSPSVPPAGAPPVGPEVAGAAAGAPEVRNTAPAPDASPTPAQIAHLYAINEKLSPDEQTVVMAAIPRMAPAARVEWLGELCLRNVDDAVALVRSMMPPLRTKRPEPTTTDAANTKEPTP